MNDFGSTSAVIDPPAGMSVLKVIKHFSHLGNTSTHAAITRHLGNHTRVILITDEQHNMGQAPETAVPDNVPLYVFNLVGYRAGSLPNRPNRVTIGGGLSDASFKLISLLESGRDEAWPWMKEDQS